MGIKKRITIYIVIVLAITSIIVYFVILPTVTDIKKISDAVYAERVDLEKKYLRGQLLKTTIENFEKIRPEKEKLASIFIAEGEELKFITALEKVAASHNLAQTLSLQALKEGEEIKDFYYPLPLKITSQGKFTDILRYLKSLEQLNYSFNISSITISPNQQQSLMINLSGDVYILPTKAEEEKI